MKSASPAPFKDHFSAHAGIYRDARPTYPAALYDWLAAQAPGTALAWDCGCGNGQASVALATRFTRVVATDPSANQIAQAAARNNVEYRVEPAEHCSLVDAGADLVAVAQALHWFDHVPFYAEVKRVLRPGGVFAAWAYSDCSLGAGALDRIKDRLYVDLTGPYWPPERVHVDAGYRTLPFPFEQVAAPVFAMRAHWSVDEVLAYFRSWSATQRCLRATGADPVAAIEAELRAAWVATPRRDVRWQFHLRAGRV